jgi:hypothetical protein
MEQRRYHIKRTCYACLFLPSSLRRLEEEADAEGEAADDDELLLARMDAGLFTLQQARPGGVGGVARRGAGGLGPPSAPCCLCTHRSVACCLCPASKAPAGGPRPAPRPPPGAPPLLPRPDSPRALSAAPGPSPTQLARISGELWLLGDVGVRRRLLGLLHQRGRTLATLRAVLLEMRATLGADGAPSPSPCPSRRQDPAACCCTAACPACMHEPEGAASPASRRRRLPGLPSPPGQVCLGGPSGRDAPCVAVSLPGPQASRPARQGLLLQSATAR